MRLLVVDDEESIRFALKDYFSQRGDQVDCAQELEEAQALLANFQYDLVIADMRLTGVWGSEGLDVVGFLKERAPWTPVVVLTAHGTPEIEAEARRRGAEAVLHKPKPLAELARVADGLVGRRGGGRK